MYFITSIDIVFLETLNNIVDLHISGVAHVHRSGGVKKFYFFSLQILHIFQLSLKYIFKVRYIYFSFIIYHILSLIFSFLIDCFTIFELASNLENEPSQEILPVTPCTMQRMTESWRCLSHS